MLLDVSGMTSANTNEWHDNLLDPFGMTVY